MVHKNILQSDNSRTFLTVSENDDCKPRKFPQFLASTLATLSALCLGMCLVWTSPALPMLEKVGAHPKITKEQGAWIGSLLTLGACLGAIPTGPIANWIGRKRTLQFLAIPLFSSWIIIAYGNCVEALYIARLLAGAAIGGVSVAAPMYVTELAHTSIRGTLGTFFQVLITVGVLLEYILDKKKTQVYAFVINDAPVCETMNKYIGNLWIDIQSQIGMEPGVCPLKKGNYSIKNALLDLSRLNVQMLLKGVFKTRVMINNRTKPFYCGDFTITLLPKKQ